MIVEKFVTDQQMDVWTDRQADGRTDGWMNGQENGQSLLDLQFAIKNWLSSISILFFSVSRIVPYFTFCIKSLFLKEKKSGTLFSLYAAHRAFQILEVVVEFWIFRPFHFGWQ